MSIEVYQKITRIFLEAIELESHEQAAFLENACEGDEKVKRKVGEMIAAKEEHPEFLERPAVAYLEDFNNERLSPGQIIGHYKLLEKIGEGGMGEIYAALNLNTQSEVALKFLSAKFSLDEEQLARFEQEAKATSKLKHQNIVTVYDFDTIGGIGFLVTELIKGKTLRERLKDGPLSLSQALEVAQSVAEALKFSHTEKIVHRDIKPENIMLVNNEPNDDLTVKILDFGVAKLIEEESKQFDPKDEKNWHFKTQDGMIIGTIAYMPPEQLHGKEADERSDIWSLGVVFYEMLQGKNPFSGETKLNTEAAILEREIFPLDGQSSRVNRIIKKALQKNSSARYQTIAEFSTDLKNIKNYDGADTFREWFSGPGKSFRKKLFIGVILTVLCSVAGILTYWNSAENFTTGIVSLIQVVVLAYALFYFERCKPKGLRLVEANGQDDNLNEDYRKATGYEKSKDWEIARDQAEVVLKQYLRDWKGVLIAWLALYAVFAFKGFVPGLDAKPTGENPDRDLLIMFVSVLITGLNNISAWKIFLCFNLLNKPTEIKQESVDDPAYSIGFWLVAAFSFVEIVFLFIFSILGLDHFLVYTLLVSNVASGIAVAITMVLYVGRLQNKFLGPGTLLVLALSSYTAIQPLFLFLESKSSAAVALIGVALILKCFLFLYMAWLFQSGRLLYYLARIRPMYQDRLNDWENFQKVLKES